MWDLGLLFGHKLDLHLMVSTNISTSCNHLQHRGVGRYLCYFRLEKRGSFSCTSVPAFCYLSWKREIQVTLQRGKKAISSHRLTAPSLHAYGSQGVRRSGPERTVSQSALRSTVPMACSRDLMKSKQIRQITRAKDLALNS